MSLGFHLTICPYLLFFLGLTLSTSTLSPPLLGFIPLFLLFVKQQHTSFFFGLLAIHSGLSIVVAPTFDAASLVKIQTSALDERPVVCVSNNNHSPVKLSLNLATYKFPLLSNVLLSFTSFILSLLTYL